MTKAGAIKRKIDAIVMTGIVSVVVAACGWSDLSYSTSASVPQPWTRMDTVEFGIPAQTSERMCCLVPGRAARFVVEVRYTGEYAYHDLWLLLRHNVTDSLGWQTDTLRCPLFDEKGHPLGVGLTDLYTIEVPYTALVPDGSSQARVQMVQCMADDSLRGITDVGIRIRNLTE